jgi:hypothetical protein
VTIEQLSNPLYWLAGLLALIILFQLVGREDKYEPWQRELNPNLPDDTRAARPRNVILISVFLTSGCALVAGYMLESIPVFALGVILVILSAWLFFKDYDHYGQDAERQGVKLITSPARRLGYVLAMMFIILIPTALCVWVWTYLKAIP